MASLSLDYINSFHDARGKLRHQFRRKGYKRTTIKGRPGSPEFMTAYHALLETTGGPLPVNEAGAGRLVAGSVDAVILKYTKHDDFQKALAPATQAMRLAILERFRECKTPSGRRYGDNKIATLPSKAITDALETLVPNAQKNWMKTLRGLMAFAVRKHECAIDPTAGIKTSKAAKSKGHMPWGDEQIAQYREHHKLGSMARLALELMLNIAARRHDVHLIGRQHLRDAQLTWRPHKTIRTTGKKSHCENFTRAAGRTRCDATEQCAGVPDDGVPSPIRFGCSVRQQICRLVPRRWPQAGDVRRWQGAQLSRPWLAQVILSGTGLCRMHWA